MCLHNTTGHDLKGQGFALLHPSSLPLPKQTHPLFMFAYGQNPRETRSYPGNVVVSQGYLLSVYKNPPHHLIQCHCGSECTRSGSKTIPKPNQSRPPSAWCAQGNAHFANDRQQQPTLGLGGWFCIAHLCFLFHSQLEMHFSL